MKKYLSLILGVLFVLGFAASAFAIHAEIPSETQAVVAKGQTQISIGGEIRTRGEVRQNVSDFNDDKQDRYKAYDSRIRLSIEAKVTPNTVGLVQIEAGDGPSANNYTWGNANPGEGQGFYKEGERKRGNFNMIQAWIQHTGSGLLGIPAGVKVGHVPLALGNQLFFDHTLFGDDAIIFFMDPMKELHIAVLTAKFREASTVLNDDSDGYVALFNYRTKEFGVSGDIVYVDDQNKFGGSTTGQDAHLWNFGLRGDTNISGLGIKADVELQAGKMEDTGGSDIKFRGYAFLAGLSYKLDPVTLSADYIYGSGDNDTDNKFEMFVTGLTQQTYLNNPGTYVYDYRTVGVSGVQFAGMQNLQTVRVAASGQIAKDVAGFIKFFWLRANKVAPGVSKSVGSEVDFNVSYMIDRNLKYWVEGGYLFAGNFWKTKTGGKDPDDAYAIRHGIGLSF